MAVLLLVLSAPGLKWLVERGAGKTTQRRTLATVVVLTAIQAAVFQWQ